MERQILTDPAHYRTVKLTFAAYLMVALKAELIGVQPIGSDKTVCFILSKTPRPSEIMAFFSGNAKVSALRFAEAMNQLKSIAHEARQ